MTVVRANPDANFAEVGRILGQMWRSRSTPVGKMEAYAPDPSGGLPLEM